MAIAPNFGDPVIVQIRDVMYILGGLLKATTGGEIDLTAGLPTNTETITVTTSTSANVYTFVDTATGAANEVHIKASIDLTTEELKRVINLNKEDIVDGIGKALPNPIPGAIATVTVAGGADNDVIVITSNVTGTASNITLAEATAAAVVTSLSGGADLAK